MNQDKKVCVVMPVYNGEKTIKMALKSLINQTYSNWECVIVNDGSNDGTVEILNSINDSRFKIIHLEKNKGRGYARQVCLDNAEGDYLAYLDADDFWNSNKLFEQVKILNNNKKIFLVGHRCLTFDSKFKAQTTRGSKSEKIIYFNLGDNLCIVMATAMIRLSNAKKYCYYSRLNASEDNEYFSRYLDGKYYMNINKILLYYFVSSEKSDYFKILEYTKNEIFRGFSLLKIKIRIGLKIIIFSFVKWLIYFIFIPILGVNFFLKRRGIVPNEIDIMEFEENRKNLTI